MNAALILSGGSGTRMGAGCPKQFLPLCGVPILVRAVRAFATHPKIGCVMVVCGADMLPQTKELLRAVPTQKPLLLTAGGATRQASSKSGLLALSRLRPQPDVVVIHDAARPLVPHAVITRCIAGAAAHGACTAALPMQDTAAVADKSGRISAIPDRSALFLVQTPQAFSFPLILNAHRALGPGVQVTDDTAVARLAGHGVFCVPGDKRSLKITTKEDLAFAQALLEGEGLTE